MKTIGYLIGLLALASVAFHPADMPDRHDQHPVGENEVAIGNQVWMTRNLDVDHFRNGDAIPHAKTVQEWQEAGNNRTPAWCYYNNDPANGPLYGKLYNWYAVSDPRGLAPAGWHVPFSREWEQLADFLGGKMGVVGIKLKSKSGWDKGRNGRNTTGFDALPGGVRDTGAIFDSNQGFGGLGVYGSWWSASGPGRSGDDLYSFVLNKGKHSTIHWNDEGVGLSVRCVKDR